MNHVDYVGFATLTAIALVAMVRSACCRRRAAKWTRAEVAPWYRETANVYLTTSYRRTDLSCVELVLSAFRPHNEVVNVWTHLIGSVYMIYQSFHVAACAAREPEGSHFQRELYYLLFFVICSSVMFTLSWVFHLFAPYGERTNLRLNRLDYCGIVTMIVGSFYPMVRVVFPEHPVSADNTALTQSANAVLRLRYLGGITALGFPLTVCAMQRFFYENWFNVPRAIFFLCFGGLGAVPFFHGLIRDGAWMEYHTSILTMGSLYIVGTVLYAMRIPERWVKRGTLDIVGASHQLFHLCICAAACVHWNGCRNGLERIHHRPLTGLLGPELLAIP